MEANMRIRESEQENDIEGNELEVNSLRSKVNEIPIDSVHSGSSEMNDSVTLVPKSSELVSELSEKNVLVSGDLLLHHKVLTSKNENQNIRIPSATSRDYSPLAKESSCEESEALSSTNKLLAKSLVFEHEWILWYDNTRSGMLSEDYESSMKVIGRFFTVEEFWNCWNSLENISNFPEGSNFRLFKQHIKPMWEDPSNENGGKFIISTLKEHTHLLWSKVVLFLIGEQFEYSDNMCGVVLSIRPSGNTINIWNSSNGDHLEEITITKEQLKKLLNYEDHIIPYRLHKETSRWKTRENSSSMLSLRTSKSADPSHSLGEGDLDNAGNNGSVRRRQRKKHNRTGSVDIMSFRGDPLSINGPRRADLNDRNYNPPAVRMCHPKSSHRKSTSLDTNSKDNDSSSEHTKSTSLLSLQSVSSNRTQSIAFDSVEKRIVSRPRTSESYPRKALGRKEGKHRKSESLEETPVIPAVLATSSSHRRKHRKASSVTEREIPISVLNKNVKSLATSQHLKLPKKIESLKTSPEEKIPITNLHQSKLAAISSGFAENHQRILNRGDSVNCNDIHTLGFLGKEAFTIQECHLQQEPLNQLEAPVFSDPTLGLSIAEEGNVSSVPHYPSGAKAYRDTDPNDTSCPGSCLSTLKSAKLFMLLLIHSPVCKLCAYLERAIELEKTKLNSSRLAMFPKEKEFMTMTTCNYFPIGIFLFLSLMYYFL